MIYIKKYIILILLTIAGINFISAQESKLQICSEEDIASSLRPKYKKQVEHFLENYYAGLLFNVNDDNIKKEYLSKFFLSENSELKPEYRLKGNYSSYISSDLYLQEMDYAFSDADLNIENLSFEIDDIQIYDAFYKYGMTGCYVIADYNLTLKESESIIYKRRCRAQCLFPQAMIYIDIRLMKVEPLEELVAYNDNTEKVLIPFQGMNHYFGYMDQNLREVFSCKFQEAGEFSEGLAAVKIKGKWGFIDKRGKIVIQCQFLNVSKFDNGLATFMEKGLYGFINRQGKVIIPAIYNRVGKFSEGLAWVIKNGNTYYIDRKGKKVITASYREVNDFSEGLAPVRKTNTWGYINKKGELVIPFKFDNALGFKEGLAEVRNGRHWGYINYNGEKIIANHYVSASEFNNGIACVQKSNNKYGFINRKGETLIPFRYDNAVNFSEGLAQVFLKGKGGYINSAGEMVIPCQFDKTRKFMNGMAQVEMNGKTFIIDKKGMKVAEIY